MTTDVDAPLSVSASTCGAILLPAASAYVPTSNPCPNVVATPRDSDACIRHNSIMLSMTFSLFIVHLVEDTRITPCKTLLLDIIHETAPLGPGPIVLDTLRQVFAF